MKLTVDRAALLKALAHVQSVVERRNTIPILSNVLLEAERRRAALHRDRHGSRRRRGRRRRRRPRRRDHRARRTPSTRSCASCPTAAEVELEPPAAAATGRFAAAGRGSTLAVLPVGRLPGHDRGRAAARLPRSPPRVLRSLIDRTRFAISTEETRYYLNGIYLHVVDHARQQGAARGGHRRPSPGRVEVTAAGGRGRHARRHRAAQDGERAAQADRRGDEDVEIGLSDTKIRFDIGRRGAHLQADRRHLPRLRAGDPRAATTRSSTSPQGVRRGGRPGRGHLQRAVAPGEAGDRPTAR